MGAAGSPIGHLPVRIGKRSPDMEGTGEIKYSGWTKTSSSPCLMRIKSLKGGRYTIVIIPTGSVCIQRNSYPIASVSMLGAAKFGQSEARWQ